MTITEDFKKFAYEYATSIIERYRNKTLRNTDEEQIVAEANVIKISFDKLPEIIKSRKGKSEFKGISISEEMFLYFLLQKNHLFNVILEVYNKEDTKDQEISDTELEKIWRDSINVYSGIERFFNTRDEHFNNNAQCWYMQLKESKLFPNIEIPFIILSQYLTFFENYRTPISCVDKLIKEMDKYELTKDQRLFIFDKLDGLIANADDETQDRFAHLNVYILDARWNIEPLDIDANEYSLENILENALKYEDVYERLKYLKHKKLEYEREAKNIGWDIGLGDEIQIEIDHIELLIKTNKFTEHNQTATFRGKVSDEIMQRVREYVSEGTGPMALKLILENTDPNNSIHHDAMIISARLKDTEREFRLGLISHETAQLNRANINHAILNINE